MRKIIVKYVSILLLLVVITSCTQNDPEMVTSEKTSGTTSQNDPEMVKVTGGTFTMGDEFGIGYDGEQPTHSVTLSDYYISKTEVTVAQYRAYCTATGESMPEEPDWSWNDNDPIVNVTWNNAIKYCDWLADKLDEDITLPTEAQWEFAARGGNQSKGYKYSGSNDLNIAGWCYDNSDYEIHRVAQKKANELGLYDMSGNVYEWCLDWYDSDYYSNSPNKNPKNTERATSKVLRGGGWISSASICRVAIRLNSEPDNRLSFIGFRVVSY